MCQSFHSACPEFSRGIHFRISLKLENTKMGNYEIAKIRERVPLEVLSFEISHFRNFVLFPADAETSLNLLQAMVRDDNS
jgi:hypothetical protein